MTLTKIVKVNILKTKHLRQWATAKLHDTTFIDVEIHHLMTSLQMFYWQTFIQILKV